MKSGAAAVAVVASDKALDNEYVFETSLRVQLTPEFSLMPDLQLVLDPANTPRRSNVLVVSLRAIVTL